MMATIVGAVMFAVFNKRAEPFIKEKGLDCCVISAGCKPNRREILGAWKMNNSVRFPVSLGMAKRGE